MGFTIGGMRDIRELRLATRRPRRQGQDRVPVTPTARAAAGTAVAEYTGLWGWDVVPGVRAQPSGKAAGPPECSCARRGCAAPGAHPLDPPVPSGAVIPAGSTLEQALTVWDEVTARAPGATVLLPTGRRFDVLEVPEHAARHAVLRVERMALPLGPVVLAPHGRAWFFVAPGGAAELPELLHRGGWDSARLDLRGLGPGAHITAPPSEHGGLGPVRWLRPPGLETAVSPPQARLLLGTLAYVCHRSPHEGHAGQGMSVKERPSGAASRGSRRPS